MFDSRILAAEFLRAGRSTILAFKRGEHFIAEQAVRTDENHVFNYASWVANRFLGFWADAASNILILTAALFTVLRREDDGSTAGNSGLTLSYVISVFFIQTYFFT